MILAALLLAACAGVGFAQERGQGPGPRPPQPPPAWAGKGRISGRVLDEQGQPVTGAIVMMRLGEAMTGPNIKTNGKGEFAAKDLGAGEWTIRVQADGFTPQEVPVTLPEKGKADNLEVHLAVDRTAEQLKELQSMLAAGDQLFKEGKYAEARAEYEKVLAARPDVLAIHRSIAYTYGREGNHEKALEHFDIALKDEPGNVQVLQLAAASAVAVNDPDRSLGYIARIDDSTIVDPDFLQNMAIAMLQKNFNPQAIRVLDRVVTKFPAAPLPYYLRAMGRIRMQNTAGGKEDLEKFLEIAPPDSPQIEQAKKILNGLK